MSQKLHEPKTGDEHVPIFISWLDRVVVGVIKTFLALAHLRSRDPRENVTNLLRPDVHEQTRIRNWEAVLQWTPRQRVGCATGVTIGILIGGAILWWGMK